MKRNRALWTSLLMAAVPALLVAETGRAQNAAVAIDSDYVFKYKREGDLWNYCPEPVVFWAGSGNVQETFNRYPYALALAFCCPAQGERKQELSFGLSMGDPTVDPGQLGPKKESIPFTVTWEPTETGWTAVALYKNSDKGGLPPTVQGENGPCQLLGAHIEARVEYDREHSRVLKAHFHYTMNVMGKALSRKPRTTRQDSAARLHALKNRSAKEEEHEKTKVPRLGRGRRAEYDTTLTMAAVTPIQENDGINAAVDKGTWFLLTDYLGTAAERVTLAREGKLKPQAGAPKAAAARKTEDHSSRFQFPVGRDALVALALVESDVSKDEPAMAKVLDTIFDRRTGVKVRTYEAGIVLMLLESVIRHIEYERDQKSARGKWLAIGEAIRRNLVGNSTDHRWSYDRRILSGDNSNTQYAFLGLRAATKLELKTKASDWRRMMRAMAGELSPAGQAVGLKLTGDDIFELTHTKGETSQDKDVPYEGEVHPGGWSYKGGTGDISEGAEEKLGEDAKKYRPTFNMTCAILSDLAIAVESVEEPCPDTVRDAMRSGWAYVQENLGSMRHAEGYKFYGIERIGVFYGIVTIGGTDWYKEGAQALVRAQRPDGSWQMRYGTDVDSAYALLFLKKATVSLSL